MKDNSSRIKQKNKKTIKIDQGWQDLLWLILGIKLGNTPGGGGGGGSHNKNTGELVRNLPRYQNFF